MNYKKKRLKEFEQEESFFETKILPADRNIEIENTPSIFYKK